MISLREFLMGRDLQFPEEFTEEILQNSRDTVDRVQKLLVIAGMCGVPAATARAVTSGWRPAGINKHTPGASKTSWHLKGCAVDLADADGSLAAWCFRAADSVLTDLGLWLEHPSATKTWCHLQTKAPKSGRRVFFP